MIAIELERVVRRHGAAGPAALDGLDLSVAPGEILALLGPSGCGKTTALRIVAGLDDPDEGVVRLGGEVVAGGGSISVPPERRGLAFVFQTHALWPHRTVLENVAYPLRIARDPGADPRAREALARVRLDGLEDRLPGQLSGGQQQRVAVARALVAKPRALLLDEPTSSLDARLREELRAELSQLARESGATTLLVTHDRADAMAVADRIAVLRAGRLEQVAAPRVLYERPASAFVAELIGSARSLPARAEGDGAVRLASGELLPAEVVGGASGPVTLCARADQVVIGEGPAEAEVIAAAYLGDRVAVELRVGGATLAALADPARHPSRGQRVRFTLRGARAFPADR